MFEREMKIAAIHWGFIPGGVSLYAHHIQDVTKHRPIKIDNFCIQAAGWPVDYANMHLMSMRSVNISGRLDLSWRKHARAFIQRDKPDLILTHGFSGAFAAAILSGGLGVPIVNTWHGDYYPTTLSQKIRKPFVEILTKILYRYGIKQIVTVSEFSKSALCRYGVDEAKVSVIYNGIPDDVPAAYSKADICREHNIPYDCILIGTACRLDAAKGLPDLVLAAASALKSRRDLKFVIWGDGPQRELLETMVRDHRLEGSVVLPGYRSDVVRYLPLLDIYVVASILENFSLSILEAMRARLPVVATEVGGNPEAIRHEIDGILVPPADPIALSQAILMLAEDKVRRERLAQSARQRFINSFTADKMISQTADWLYDCAEKYKPSDQYN